MKKCFKIKTLGQLKVGDYFALKPYKNPTPFQVWICVKFNNSARTVTCVNWAHLLFEGKERYAGPNNYDFERIMKEDEFVFDCFDIPTDRSQDSNQVEHGRIVSLRNDDGDESCFLLEYEDGHKESIYKSMFYWETLEG